MVRDLFQWRTSAAIWSQTWILSISLMARAPILSQVWMQHSFSRRDHLLSSVSSGRSSLELQITAVIQLWFTISILVVELFESSFIHSTAFDSTTRWRWWSDTQTSNASSEEPVFFAQIELSALFRLSVVCFLVRQHANAVERRKNISNASKNASTGSKIKTKPWLKNYVSWRNSTVNAMKRVIRIATIRQQQWRQVHVRTRTVLLTVLLSLRLYPRYSLCKNVLLLGVFSICVLFFSCLLWFYFHFTWTVLYSDSSLSLFFYLWQFKQETRK